MKDITKNNDAVSPVVGVMLMLVVTIIIAAVVASFAGGLTGSTTATPNVLITVQDVSTSSGYLNEILFIHKGGDSLSLANTKVSLQCLGYTTEFTVAGGTLTGDSTISVGDQMTVDASGAYATSGSVMDYTIIDLTTGNAIASGSFVVP